MTPEFSRSFRLDEIGATPLSVAIEANEEECAALAQRFALLDITALSATAQIKTRDHQYVAEGSFKAQVTQACVVTGERVPAKLNQRFKLRFIDELAAAPTPELELNFDGYDDMPLSGETIDLGEAVAQSVLLALEPFPRGPNAARHLREAGVIAEGEEPRGAFAGLKNLLG